MNDLATAMVHGVADGGDDHGRRRFAPRGLWTPPVLPGPLTAHTDAPPTPPWMAASDRRHPQALGKPAHGRRFSTAPPRPLRLGPYRGNGGLNPAA